MSDEKNELLIRVDHVTKRYRKFKAVDDVSFVVAPGEVVGFVGENGAGKTTTISMLLGFMSPSEGDVSLFGERVTPATAHRSHAHIGYAAGDMELPDTMTGAQYIKFVMAQSGGKKHGTRLAALTKTFQPQLNKKIGSLSRGNKQKIALVAALVTEPQLIVLDEPTSGLDPVMQGVFLDTIREESARGTTVFMSSHYLQEVAEVCTRVLLMKDGRVVEDLSQFDLAARAGKTVTLMTRTEAHAPEHATAVETSRAGELYQLSFSYTGHIEALLAWVGEQKDVADIEITERTLEEEFKHIYNDKKSEVSDE